MFSLIRSTLTAGVALAMGVFLQNTALPKLAAEREGLEARLPEGLAWMALAPGWTIKAPLAALVICIVAMVLKPLRPILVIPAMLASLFAVLVIAFTVMAALMPMYQMPEEF
jgi:hypothetical protein